MESFLKSYDDIDVVICENDNEAFGAIDAIKAAGKTCGPDGDIIVVGFDSVKAAFESMIAGDLNATFEMCIRDRWYTAPLRERKTLGITEE